MTVELKALFAQRKPCENCPFRKNGAIALEPGRVAGIIDNLIADDQSTFLCHKTVHSRRGGEWDDDGNYAPSGRESYCAGALIYLHKAKMPNVAMRLGWALGMFNPGALADSFDDVIDPQTEG
ncbi:Uncharacterised protein [Burkholderia pseudomallei]|nr:Uncharacterised protein [Burkholderia pseudomallei]